MSQTNSEASKEQSERARSWRSANLWKSNSERGVVDGPPPILQEFPRARIS